MIDYFGEAFRKISVLMVVILLGTGYTAAVSALGMLAVEVFFSLAAVSLFIGFLWTVVAGVYLPWVWLRTKDVWKRWEAMAAVAELPITMRDPALVAPLS